MVERESRDLQKYVEMTVIKSYYRKLKISYNILLKWLYEPITLERAKYSMRGRFLKKILISSNIKGSNDNLIFVVSW